METQWENACGIVRVECDVMSVTLCRQPHAERMKDLAGREQDRIDIEHVRMGVENDQLRRQTVANNDGYRFSSRL